MRPRNLVASIRLTAASGPLRAPDRFRIWRAGPNPGDYGELIFTPAAASAVMGDYARRGNALVMDYEHALNPTVNPTIDPARPPPTAGYLALELMDGDGGKELWGVPRWSDCGRQAPVPGEICCAKHQIESGQRCYVSPDWQIDTETREPMKLNRVSLVAEPATYGINLLASARAANGGSMDEMGQMRAGYAAAKAMMASEDKAVAKAASTLCAAYESAATTLGIKLAAEGTSDAAPPSERAEGQATAAEQTTEDEKKANMTDDKGKGGGQGQAVASVTASRAAAPGKALTMADVRREIAEQNERSTLLAGIKGRVPEGHANLVATMNLPQLRDYARGLPAPVQEKGTQGDTGANVTAGKGTTVEPELTPDERYQVRRWGRQLEIKDANMTAAREAWKADPATGEIEVDVFKHVLRGPTGRGVSAAQ